MAAQRIAIVGAGPVGIEAALYARSLGHRVRVYERGRVGEHLLQWGHVRLFTPFSMNHSTLGASVLTAAGHALPDDDAYLSGREHVEHYLEPLARSEPLRGAIREHVEVVSLGRERLLKGDKIGGDRDAHPFRLLVRKGHVEAIEPADILLDCSGTWATANPLGNAGIPAPGEAAAREVIRYRLDDVLGTARDAYEGRRILLVGSGHSAATALDQLLQLDSVEIVWVRRDTREQPFARHDDDPLPERDRLGSLGNRLAAGADPRVEVCAGSVVERVERSKAGVRVTVEGPDGRREIDVDRVLALVGYRPDRTLYAELQFHECWATLGPMKLAASLLGADGGDCLAQTSAGAETLTSPEPGFFVLGAKSYGRNVNFLIRLGLEQIRDVFTLVEGDPGLDLYTRGPVAKETEDGR